MFNEHNGFGFSYSLDGVKYSIAIMIVYRVQLQRILTCACVPVLQILWSDGVDITMPGGCRTPLGFIENANGSLTMFFTRRFADCSNKTQEVVLFLPNKLYDGSFVFDR